MWDRVEVLRQIGVHDIGVAPAEKPVHFLDRVACSASGTIAIGTVLEVRLEDRFEHELGGSLNHPIPNRRDAERAFSAPGFGIITRRTGIGRYVLATRSSRRPASHFSSPDASMCSNVLPSTPGAPALPRATS